MLLALASAFGCGSPDIRQKAIQRPKKEERTEIQTGSARVWLPGSWTMEVDDSQVAFTGEKDSLANVQSVKGSLLQGETVQSRFTAREGSAETSSGRLVLIGAVRITSENDDLVLTAMRVTYDKGTALIVAEGSVKVTSADWESGPFEKLVATPGLEKVGTPDRFKT